MLQKVYSLNSKTTTLAANGTSVQAMYRSGVRIRESSGGRASLRNYAFQSKKTLRTALQISCRGSLGAVARRRTGRRVPSTRQSQRPRGQEYPSVESCTRVYSSLLKEATLLPNGMEVNAVTVVYVCAEHNTVHTGMSIMILRGRK